MRIKVCIHTHDADRWVTLHPNGGGSTGTHILVGSNGEVKAGAGGKFNGRTLSEVAKKRNPDPSGNSRQPTSQLTANEKSALSSYSGDDFLRVNRELRSGNSSDPIVRRIDSAIDKSSLAPGQVLYRGMTREAAKKLFAGGNITKGMSISDPAFASTSKSPGIAKMIGTGGVVLKIEVGKGAKGLDMSTHSRNAHEQEVLLPRNAQMKVVGLTPPKSPMDPVIVRVAYGD